MPRLQLSIVVALLAPLAMPVALAAGQTHADSPATIEAGGRIFQASCARCHGTNGDQVLGVTLATGQFRRAATEAELVKLMIGGIAGTGMPATNLSEPDASNVAAYLRSLASGGPVSGISAESLPGNMNQGKALVETKGQCLTCHRIGEGGARAGLDLSGVGARPPEELRRSIVDPDAEIRPEHRTVRVVTRAGTTVSGRLLNHDLFTVQVLDAKERLQSFTKAELREFTILKASPMPSYRDTLSAAELTDIVKYLSSLRGRP